MATAASDGASASQLADGSARDNSNAGSANASQAGLKSNMSDDTLIGLLQASVDRLQVTSNDQRVANEMQSRDSQRNLVMIKLAQEQVERTREVNERLKRDADTAKRQCQAATEEAEKLRATVDELELKARVDASSSDRTVKDIQTQLKAERGERATVQSTLDRVRAELEEARSAAVTDAGSRDGKYRELFQDHATLKARCATQKEEIEFLEAQRSKEVRQVAEREYSLNRSIGELKAQLAERESQIDSAHRSTVEQVGGLSADNESMRIKIIQLEGMLQATDRDGAQRIQQLRQENRLLQERNETDMHAATAREKALQQETATLAAHLRSAQKEINELADKEDDAKRKSMTDVVALHAERDTLAAKVASLERQLTEARGKAQAEAVTLRTDAEVAKNDKVLAEQRFATDLAVQRDENAKLRDELSLLGQQLADAQAAAKREEARLNEVVDTQSTDLRQLRVEVDGYKESVAKLETHLRENYAVRILEDEVSSLKAQNVQLKNQLTHANSALANMRVEADISETSRMRTMQEQVTEAQRRVATLEREARFSRPLLADLVEAAQHAQCLDAALERDVDLFFRQFGNSASA